MNRDAFWKLIDASRASGGIDLQCADLERLLEPLSVEELVSFHWHFYQLYNAAYRADLWGAAYVINGGCSDDGFDYFRGYLIGRGQAVYEAALADPDSLAATVGEDEGEQEGLLSLAVQVYLKRTGKTYSDLNDFDPFVHEGQGDLVGDLADWYDDEDEDAGAEKLSRLYPRLYAKFE